MKGLIPLSNVETAVARRISDGFPFFDAFSAGCAIHVVQVCAEALLAEARRAQPGTYRQGLEDAAHLLTGTDPDSNVVVPLQRKQNAAPDGAA